LLQDRATQARVKERSGGEKKRVSITEALASQAMVGCWNNSTRRLDTSTHSGSQYTTSACTAVLRRISAFVPRTYLFGFHLLLIYSLLTCYAFWLAWLHFFLNLLLFNALGLAGGNGFSPFFRLKTLDAYRVPVAF